MKNATKYQKKLKKLLAGIDKAPKAPPEGANPYEVMLRAILEANASAKLTERAMAAIEEEFVDINELRVSPPKEVADCLGKDYPEARRKAHEITGVLNATYIRRNKLSFDHVEKMTKRELRRHLAELGLSAYPAACLMLCVFGGHAVPVDETLVECLEMGGYIEPGSALEDVQGFLERVILQKHALAAHELFREYIAKSARALARRRKAAAAAKAEAEARAEAEAEAKAQAEKERARAAAKKARKAKAKAKKVAKKTPKAKKAPAKGTGRTAKGSSKRQAKMVKKTRQGTKKSAKRASKKTKK